MRILLGVITGTAIALFLSILLAGKTEKKDRRIGLQVSAYIVFILFGLAFTSLFSLRTVLDKFIFNRIQDMEAGLSRMFPDSNILETSINTNELVSMNNQIQQSINDINTSNDGFLEKLVYKVFIYKLSNYIKTVDSGVNTLAAMNKDNGIVTVKDILYNFKDIALDTISPFFTVLQIILLILFIITLGIYLGIIINIKKRRSLYNKSIVYGDNNEQ
jgi:hypothetical protein